jgi:hypothetical protein
MRTSLTEDENQLLGKVVNQFCRDFAKITAEALSQFPEAVEEYVTDVLQDATSLYSPYTSDQIRIELKRLRSKL